MSAMKVTIRGFYDFFDSLDMDLFKNLIIPNSPLLDRDTLILNILQKSDDMESLYSDPYYLQESIKYWSKRWNRTFQKWVDSLNLVYNPLFNYDKFDTVIDKTTVERDISDADSTRTITDDDSHTGTDLTAATNTDVTEGTATDLTAATASDVKEEINTDVTAATATDLTESVNTDSKVSTETDLTVKTKTDITEDSAISAFNSQNFQPDKSTHTTGDDDKNQTNTSGNKDKNYVQTTGDYDKNYTKTAGDDDKNFVHTTGEYDKNYTHTTGDDDKNYVHTIGDDDKNYVHTTGDDDKNYVHTTGESSKNFTERDIDSSFTRMDKVDDDSVKDFSHSQHEWGKDTPDKYADMVKAELELAKWNIYDHIADIFVQEFCIMVY